MRVQVVLQHRVADIPLPANLVRDDRWDPGAETGMHEHRNILRAGQVSWRPARETHNVRNISEKPARVLAIHFDPAR